MKRLPVFFQSESIMKWIALTMLVFADVAYKIMSEKVSGDINPFASMIITYGAAMIASFVLFFLTAKGSPLSGEMKKLNIYSVLIGLIICFYELGFIFAFRCGFKMSLLSPLMSVAIMVFMALIGVLFYKEKISPMNTIGLIIASIGVLMTIS